MYRSHLPFSLLPFCLALVGMFGGLSSPLKAQQQPRNPQLISLFPAGGQAGEVTSVKILEQADLEFADELLFSHPGITARPRTRPQDRFFPDETPLRNEFLVSVADDVPPGIHEVRARCEYGISNPRRFVVSAKPEINEQEPNDQFEQANDLAVDAVANGLFEAGYDVYRVKVQPGQSLVFRCVAEQIDSPGDPVIEIYDSDQQLIRKNHDTGGKDALVSFQAAREEEIYVRVNDLTFVSQGGNGTTPYRLMVSTAPWIDYVDPPVIPRGGETTIRLFGRNLGGGQSGVWRDGVELESLEVSVNASQLVEATESRFSDCVLPPSSYAQNRLVYRLATPRGVSNPVLLEAVDGKLVRESAEESVLTPDTNVLGVFSEPGEVDRYRVSARQGEKFWIEVTSQRLGIATDPLIVIERIQEDGQGQTRYQQVMMIDDFQPLDRPFRLRLETEDPAALWEVPADGEYRISISDQFNLPADHNGPNYYRLTFRRPAPAVDLVAIPGLECGNNDNHSRPLKITPCIVRPGGGAEIQVFAYRAPGFDQDIELIVSGLPPGVSAEPCLINRHANHGTIVLTGQPGLKSGFSTVRIVGKYSWEGREVTVPVAAAEVLTNSIGNEPSESRLNDEIVVVADAATDFPGRIVIAESFLETAVGGTIEFRASLEKHGDHKGAIQQGYVHGLPRTVSSNTQTIPDNGQQVDYKLNFRQPSDHGEYTVFIRGYFEENIKRFESRESALQEEQKRLATVIREVESEYRQAGQEKQKLANEINNAKRDLTNLANQIRTAKTGLAMLESKLAAAGRDLEKMQQDQVRQQEELKKLAERKQQETDAGRQQQLTDQEAGISRQLTNLKGKLEQMRQESKKFEQERSAAETELATLGEKEKETQQNLTRLEQKLAETTEMESRLQGEVNRGQELKREIDQDFNLARQAARDRRCRFLVYSDPIRIKVREYPVELELSSNAFEIPQGETATVKVRLKRLFEFDDPVTIQLRPESGASGWAFRQDVKLATGEEEADAEIVVQKNAKLGEFSGEIRATMRFGSANLTKTVPIRLAVKPGE